MAQVIEWKGIAGIYGAIPVRLVTRHRALNTHDLIQSCERCSTHFTNEETEAREGAIPSHNGSAEKIEAQSRQETFPKSHREYS